MIIEKISLKDLASINPIVLTEKRGYFFEVYNQTKFQDNRIMYEFIQDNQSFSKFRVIQKLT